MRALGGKVRRREGAEGSSWRQLWPARGAAGPAASSQDLEKGRRTTEDDEHMVGEPKQDEAVGQ